MFKDFAKQISLLICGSTKWNTGRQLLYEALKISGGDASMGNTRSHTEHDG